VRAIIDNAYQPAAVRVSRHADDAFVHAKHDSGCGNTVVIPSLGKTLDLHVGKP
jgi:hypothetical protein